MEGIGLTESMHINKSLTSLGRTLHAVVTNEGKTNTKKSVITIVSSILINATLCYIFDVDLSTHYSM